MVTSKEVKELKEGLEVEYYGNNYEWIKNPSIGVVKYDKEIGFYIKWSDLELSTILDGSDKSNSILSRCGWY